MESLEDLPARLQAPVGNALTWVNAQQKQHFELTGLVGAQRAVAAYPNEAFELGLVLCDGEFCARQDLTFTPTANGYSFGFAQTQEPDIPPELDPPRGIRTGWLEKVLQKHEFVLLLFYRGLW